MLLSKKNWHYTAFVEQVRRTRTNGLFCGYIMYYCDTATLLQLRDLYLVTSHHNKCSAGCGTMVVSKLGTSISRELLRSLSPVT
jgi:hypothetical protein